MSSKRALRRACAQKVAYPTQADAILARKRRMAAGILGLGVYACEGHWHIGHIPFNLRQSIRDRRIAVRTLADAVERPA